jgi:glycosyltransferase involved in cell wall biosynthesis
VNIVIDIRPLLGGKTSGVEIYIRNLLKNLLSIDKKNKYILFANASKGHIFHDAFFNEQNVLLVQTRIPNKILNLGIFLWKRPRFDRLILRWMRKNKDRLKHQFQNIKQIDLFFMPDVRPSALSKVVKKITVVHDLSFEHYPRFFSLKTRLWHKLLQPRKEIQRSDHIIAVSECTKKDLIQTYNIRPEKIQVILEGVHRQFGEHIDQSGLSRVRKKYQLPSSYFLFLSTLEPRKNMLRLVEAFLIFKRNNPENNMKLVMAGVTNQKIFSKIRLKEHKNILFTGFIAEEDKAAVMKGAQAFFYPSLFEGFGLPLVEAMKCQTPIVSSNLSSMPEILGEAGILIDPYNIEEMAKAMEKILQPEIRKKLQQKMAEQVKKFDWEKCAEETLGLFEQMNK